MLTIEQWCKIKLFLTIKNHASLKIGNRPRTLPINDKITTERHDFVKDAAIEAVRLSAHHL
ncbi:hypothetical protein T06_3683 [Trichinella sp. T6]|nr:hypothetical protein T06_3683 [Trichinella sp. T6]